MFRGRLYTGDKLARGRSGCPTSTMRTPMLLPKYKSANASGSVFTTAYTQRFSPCAVRLAEMAAEKQFGKVISLENVSATTDVRLRNPSHYLFDPEENKYPRGEGGYFSWLGCHNLDMVRFVSGQKIVGVTARVGVYGETEAHVEDGGAIIIELADGALVTLIGGCALPP